MIAIKRIQIRATDDLIAKLDRLCEVFGLDRSAVVRMLITQAERNAVGHPPRAPEAADGGGGTTTPPYGDH